MAVRFSQWWSGDENCTDLFWRTAMSGGRATVRARKGLKTRGHAGDLCATDSFGQPLTRYCILELKKGHQGNATVQDLLDKKKGGTVYGGWIEKLEKACETHGIPYWMIIHGRDKREPLVLFSEKAFPDFSNRWRLYGHKPMICLQTGPPTWKKFCISTLNDFFDCIPPEWVRSYYKEWKKCRKALKSKARKT